MFWKSMLNQFDRLSCLSYQDGIILFYWLWFMFSCLFTSECYSTTSYWACMAGQHLLVQHPRYNQIVIVNWQILLVKSEISSFYRIKIKFNFTFSNGFCVLCIILKFCYCGHYFSLTCEFLFNCSLKNTSF